MVNKLQEVELKHLDSWTKLEWGDTTNNEANHDDTWSQFKNRDALNKQRVRFIGDFLTSCL